MTPVSYWFRCPSCGLPGSVDEDQVDGCVSIQCTTDGCNFHETCLVPKVETTVPTKPEDMPTLSSQVRSGCS